MMPSPRTGLFRTGWASAFQNPDVFSDMPTATHNYCYCRRRRAVVGAGMLVMLATACGEAPTTPSPMGPTVALILPSVGPTESSVDVRIVGRGFEPGATVTMDGPVTNVAVASSTLITATAPPHPAGAVDVIVNNPDGRSARLTGGFTYAPVKAWTLTVSPELVAAGGRLTVTWTVTGGQSPLESPLDWIGMFSVGAQNTDYGLWVYTNGATSGTWTLNAPGQPGEYEFRYLPDDGYIDVARSPRVIIRD